MSWVVIGILKDNQDKFGYRLLNLDSKTIVHVSKENLLNSIKSNKVIDIINFKYNQSTNNFEEINNEESRYPVILTTKNAGVIKDTDTIIENKIIIIEKLKTTYRVTDATGKIREATYEQIISNENKIANITYARLNKIEKKNLVDVLDSVINRLGIKIPDIKHIKMNEIPKNSDIEHAEIKDNQSEKFDNTEEKILPTEEVKKEEEQVSVEDENESLDTDYKLKIEKRNDGAITVIGIEPKDYNGIVKIPTNVTHIEASSFAFVPIHGIELSESLIYIGDSAFSHTRLKEVTLPTNITTIPKMCFAGTLSLKSINLEHITTIGNEAFINTGIEEVKLSDDIQIIGMNSFRGCKNLRKFEHNNTITKIRQYAFFGCKNLEDFEFTGVSDIEDFAFAETGLKSVELGPDVTYILANSFTSAQLTEVKIEKGGYKIADSAFVNTAGNPITYTLSKDITNIGKNVFKEKDTVKCYHKSIADVMAIQAGCNIEYIDDFDGQRSKTIMKAKTFNIDVTKLVSDLIRNSYDKEDVEYTYELKSSDTINIELDQKHLDYLGLTGVNIPADYNEKPKFKLLLDYYANYCKLYAFPLTERMIALKDTVTIEHKTIYDDGISRIYDFTFNDNKYESKKSNFILAVTGNNVRFACLHNKYTDIYCNTNLSKDLSKLLEVLIPGDVIGYECIINGQKYSGISGVGDKQNEKTREKYPVNLYQALFKCAITAKLDKNYIAMILPANNKILKCASIGKSVWLNETEKSYKERQCSILEIQDYDTNTILENSDSTWTKDDILFKELQNYGQNEIAKRVEEYSKIGKSKISEYIQFRNFSIKKSVKDISELSTEAALMLMRFPVVEERTPDWFYKNKDKNIVPYTKFMFTLKDGGTLLQYRTMKRVAMRNKLLTGGDRDIYVFELLSSKNVLLGIFASNMTFDELFETGLKMVKTTGEQKRVYKNKGEFDIVDRKDVELIAAAFVTTQEKQKDQKDLASNIWLVVYKPNGLYYIAYLSRSEKHSSEAILMVQVGELDIVTDYIDCATNKSSRIFKLLYGAGSASITGDRTYGYFNSRASEEKELILKARSMVIDGIDETKKYTDIGIPPVLAHMFGVNNYDDSIYNIPEAEK